MKIYLSQLFWRKVPEPGPETTVPHWWLILFDPCDNQIRETCANANTIVTASNTCSYQC